MTRARLVREISNDEFVLWSRFYSRDAQRQELATKMGGAA